MTVPDRSEAAEYYHRYIDQVVGADICRVLKEQAGDTLALLRRVSDEQSLHRYEPDKWSIREVVSHLNDTERVFVFRALWFARGFDTPLPSFEQDTAAGSARANERTWQSHVGEFLAVRASTVSFFENLPTSAWSKRGMASGYEFSVRALAYITAGHVTHHLKILRERYLNAPSKLAQT